MLTAQSHPWLKMYRRMNNEQPLSCANSQPPPEPRRFFCFWRQPQALDSRLPGDIPSRVHLATIATYVVCPLSVYPQRQGVVGPPLVADPPR